MIKAGLNSLYYFIVGALDGKESIFILQEATLIVWTHSRSTMGAETQFTEIYICDVQLVDERPSGYKTFNKNDGWLYYQGCRFTY